MRRSYWIITALCLSVFTTAASAKNYMRVYYVLWGNGAYGDSIFIQLPGADKTLDTPDDKNVLIDGGGQSTAATSHLDNFLDYLEVTTINHMVLTHPHDDHYAGLNLVLNNYTVDNFYCTGTTEQNTVQTALNSQASCTVYKMSDYSVGSYLSGPDTNVGTAWDPNVVCKVLAFNNAASDNARSLVLKLSMGEASFLFGGDATVSVESGISSSEGPVDFYKMHHHGSSATSNDTTFLSWLAPSYSILPTGGRSSPPPDATAISRVIDIESIIYRTDLDGTILVKADDAGNFDIVRMTAFAGNKDSHNPASFPGDSYGTFDLSAGMPYVLAPPSLPKNLAVKEIAGDDIKIDWDYDVSPSIAGYYLFYSTYPGGDPGANNVWKNAGMSEETGIYKRHDTLLTSAPFTFSALALGLTQPSYLRLSAVTTYYYERRYSNEVYTTWPPTAITNLTGFCVSGTGGDVRLSWTAPAKYNSGSSLDPCKKYFVYYSTDPTLNTDLWNEVDSLSKYGIDFSTIQPKNPGDGETFVIENIPAPGNSSETYFAVFSQNSDGVFSHISNIATFTVVDVYPPLPVTDLAYALWRDESRIFISWTAQGDDGQEGSAAFCEIIFSNAAAFSAVSTQTILSPVFTGQKQTYLMTGLDPYERYWIKVRTYDEALNFSTSNEISCYTGTNFINTPSFENSVSVSTSPTLDVTFKIEIDTISSGSPANCVELWDTRDNLGAVPALTKLTTNQYQVTASTDSRGFSVSPGLEFNHRYKLVISSSLKDIDGETLMSAATYFYFVTLCSPFENNIFFASDGSSVTVASGQFSSPASLVFISNPLSDSAVLAAYNVLIGTYPGTYIISGSVRGFTVAPGTVTAIIPVSGGIPYVYNSASLSFEKAVSYISGGEVVFDAESPAVWLFLTPASFTANKDPGVYAYPVPCTGNSITFTNLGASAEIGVFTISGKCVMREK
ncbi:MBL fold metallo-hydrolase, partial [bacterium]|nr:MBL fold metallo-hydrolase [bacterium]